MTKWVPISASSPEQKLPQIGDYARCSDGHHGIVTKVANSYYGPMIFIVEDNGNPYRFPAYMLRSVK